MNYNYNEILRLKWVCTHMNVSMPTASRLVAEVRKALGKSPRSVVLLGEFVEYYGLKLS